MKFISRIPLKVTWDLGHENPRLLEKFFAQEPDVRKTYEASKEQMFVARSCLYFNEGPFVRPSSHRRAFYLETKNGTIAFKGTEVFSENLKQGLALLRDENPNHNLIEHFAVIEKKIPYALKNGEAIEEAERALDFQSVYFKKFHEFAKIPVPLLICRVPEIAQYDFLEKLKPFLKSEKSQKQVLKEIKKLSCYVYYYSGNQVRVRDLCQYIRDLGLPQSLKRRLQKLEDLSPIHPRKVTERWMDLVARMLALGYLPVNPKQKELGHCVQFQNAVIDGGLVDCGSLIHMSEIEGQENFLDGLAFFLRTFNHTLRSYFTYFDTEDIIPRDLLTSSFLIAALRDRIMQYRGSRLRLDSRLNAFFNEKDWIRILMGLK